MHDRKFDPEFAAGVRSIYTKEIDETIKFAFTQIPINERAEIKTLAQRLAKASVYVSLKAGIDPVEILKRELLELGTTEIAMDMTEEGRPRDCFPRLPHVLEVMSDDEIQKFAEPIRACLLAMSLAGVPATRAAGILMTFAAQILLQATHDAKAVTMAFNAFGREVEKSQRMN